MTSTAAHRPPTAARPRARAVIACALIGAGAALARAQFRPLPEALAARGLHVVPRSVHWLDPPSVLHARRALLLARQGDGLADLYAVTARTGPDDRVITLRDVSNLTRSRDASEEALVVRGEHAAFATRVGSEIVAFTVVDTRGDAEEPSPSRGARFRTAVTRLQQTGRTRGYGFDRFDLIQPTHALTLSLRDARLAVRGAEHEIALDLAGAPQLADGEWLVRERPRHAAQSGTWITWAVDTVRAVPWIGPVPIAWAESWAFRAQHAVARARVAVSGDNSQREVAEDLADVLQGGHGAAVEGAVEQWPPERLRGLLSSPLAHEGEWSAMGGEDDPFMRANPGAPAPMYITFVRSDRERPDSRVYVSVWDPRQVEIHVVPGSEEPMGATGETGTGAIPRDERTMTHLLAGFNGAFQALHGEYGVYGEGTVLLPAKPYAATVALLADGNTGFGTWPRDQSEIPQDVVEFRQNLTPLVDAGRLNPWHRTFWGGTVPGAAQDDPHTARSGICMTREGHVAYLWGATLTPQSLGDGMLAARCTYGIHLDMNGANTGFELYRADRTEALPRLGRALARDYEAEGAIGGLPGMSYRTRKLVRSMSETLPRYIRRDPRDFFYLLLRSVLPGAPLTPPVSPAQAGEGTWHVAGLSTLPFPWPMARTRVRPDPANPERWVNLLRIDPRRVALAAPDAQESVVARFVNAPLAEGEQLRIGMSEGVAGARWTIGAEGDGVAGQVLAPGMNVTRGAGIDGNGYLVFAVADRPTPDLIARALDLAGCGPTRIALTGASLQLPAGAGAAGEAVPPGAVSSLSLVARAFGTARRLFPEVQPLPISEWQPVQRRQVRYHLGRAGTQTMEVHLVGRQQPVILPQRGVPRRVNPGGGAPGTPGAAPTPPTP